MAVTQQLARVPVEVLTASRARVEALHTVCSFHAAAAEDYLDLDWWPGPLILTWRRMVTPERDRELLRRAFDGDDEVNPAYRAHPATIWWHPVTALEPGAVGDVAAALDAITPDAVRLTVASLDRAALGPTAASVEGDLPGILSREHRALRSFYAGAAERGLATILWWD